LIAENERQDVNLVRRVDQRGCGLDGLWNDDFHHSARVALTGQREAYYTDYRGGAQELVSAVKRAYLYQGQWYAWQKKRRGSSSRGVEPWRFINYLDNHDQISNSGFGERIHERSHPGCHRALTTLFLLTPGTPMLFQGQEFGASSHFTYFADHNPELAKQVYRGRLEFVSQFPSLARPESRACVADPGRLETFEMCKLKDEERSAHGRIYHLHRDLLELRRSDAVFRAQGAGGGIDGAVLGPKTFALRFFGQESDRLVLVNLDVDLDFDPAPEPLLAPPQDTNWTILFASEHPKYGGRGIVAPSTEGNWTIQGFCALVLTCTAAANPHCENLGA
jgi:maltooligosyltrehalose trehalohydrolase